MSVQVDLSSEHRLIVFVDVKSPYAFVAIEPTWRLLDELNMVADWRPFTLDIPSYLGSAKLNKSGAVVENKRSKSQWTGVKYAYKDARRYAAMQGKTLRGTEKIWDSSLAGIGLLWAKSQGQNQLRAYLEQVYQPFWRRELDIESVAVVASVLKAANVDVAGFTEFAADAGRRMHDEINEAAFAAGVFGVPSYCVDGEMFFGREHLPMVAWLLKGGDATAVKAPDIAYE